MLNRRPSGPTLCWMMAFFIASYQQLLWSPNSIGVPEGPLGRVWLSLPHLVYNSVRSLTGTVLTSVLTELYNSSTPTQSPTRSLKSHVWSSSSGNNCHAVHRSLSSGASVYECTMGIFFSSSHFVSQFPPTRFPLITAIRMCHLLPVHHLGMAFLAGSKAKIQHNELSSLVCSIPKHNFLVVGRDMNDQIGKNRNYIFSLYNSSNRNGQHLTDFTIKKRLKCLNTNFQKREGKLWTYTYANNTKAERLRLYKQEME